MKPTRLRRTAPTVRRPRYARLDDGFTDAHALPIIALTLLAAVLLTGATLAAVTAVVPITVPTLVVGWAAAVGLAFATPLVVVRGVVALLERYQ